MDQSLLFIKAFQGFLKCKICFASKRAIGAGAFSTTFRLLIGPRTGGFFQVKVFSRALLFLLIASSCALSETCARGHLSRVRLNEVAKIVWFRAHDRKKNIFIFFLSIFCDKVVSCKKNRTRKKCYFYFPKTFALGPYLSTALYNQKKPRFQGKPAFLL